MKQFYFLPAFLLVLHSLQAQYYATVTYTSRDGLPTSELLSVMADSKGYVWITSTQGVSRFDGQTFRNFSVEDGLSTNHVIQLIEDAKGRIWCNHQIGTGDIRYSIIEGDKIRKISFSDQYGGEQGILQYNPHTKEIWITTTPGLKLYAYDDERDTFLLRSLPLQPSVNANQLLVDPFKDRLLCMQTPTERPEGWILEKGLVTPVPDPPSMWDNHLFLPDGRIYCMDKLGKAFTYDAKNGWTPFEGRRTLQTYPPSGRAPAEVQTFLRRTGRPAVYDLIEFSAEYPDGIHYRFFSTSAIALYGKNTAKAPDGTYWIASREGLIHLFPYFMDFLIREENWYMSDLHALCEDKYGNMWFASYSNGLSFFDGEKVNQATGALTSYNKFLTGSVRDDEDNMLFWLEGDVTRKKYGLLSVDGAGNAELLLDTDIGYYLTRSHDGQLALGLNKFRLAIYDPKSENPWLGKVIGREKGLQIENVITTVKDRQGRWWIGRPSSGLAYYDPVQDTVFNFLREDPARDFGVMSSEMDARGNLWLGTTHGLYFFDPSKPIDPASFKPWETFRPIGKNILGASQVNVVKLLDDSTLLVGNYEGIALADLNSYYKTGKPLIYQFGQKDGYSGLGVEQNAVWIDSKGFVWLASDAGAHRFDPRMFIRPRGVPAFSIDSLVVGGRAYLPVPGQAIRLRAAARHQTLNVHLSTEYDPIRTNHVFFSYKLKKDSAYSAPTPDKIIPFTNLGPGKYTLQVKVMKDGSESEIQELEIFIPKPIFENPWTYVLLMSILGMSAWAVQRNRNRQKMEKNKLQVQAIVNQLNPHFINNALQWVQIRVYRDDDAVGVISKLGENIRLVFKNSREKKAFHSLEEEMKLVENYLFIQKKRFTSHLDYELPHEAQVKALGQVMVPLMQIQIHCENAVEHGIRNKEENGLVKVVLEDEGDYIRIVVEDSGVGRRKAASIGSKGTQQGTKMLENLKDIFNSRNLLPIESWYEDDIFTSQQGEGYGTRVLIRIPKNYRYEFD